MKSKSFFLQLLCSIVLCLSCIAQTTMINLHVLYLPGDKNPEPLDLFLGDKKTIQVELPSNSVSKNHQVSSLPEWVLGKATVEKGKFKFESYGKAKSISSENQLIVISRKSEEEGGGLNMVVVDYNKNSYKGGMYYFINMTDTDIEGTIGKSEFSLEPHKFALLAPEPDKVTDTRKYCYAKFSYEKEDAMHPFLSSTWRFSENARSLVIFYRDLTTKQMRFHTVRSYIE